MSAASATAYGTTTKPATTRLAGPSVAAVHVHSGSRHERAAPVDSLDVSDVSVVELSVVAVLDEEETAPSLPDSPALVLGSLHEHASPTRTSHRRFQYATSSSMADEVATGNAQGASLRR